MAQSSLKKFFGAAVGSDVQPAKRLLSSTASAAKAAARTPDTGESLQTAAAELSAGMIERKGLLLWSARLLPRSPIIAI